MARKRRSYKPKNNTNNPIDDLVVPVKGIQLNKSLKDNIEEDIKYLNEKVTGLSEDVTDLLDVKKELLRSDEETGDIKTRGISSLEGKDKETNLELNELLKMKMSAAAKNMGNYLRSPVAWRMHQIIENQWLMAEMPSLEEALDHFIDDVVNGESWGTNTLTERFKIIPTSTDRKIGDNNELLGNSNSIIKSALNADDPKSIMSNKVPIYKTQRAAIRNARAHGFAIVAVYSHQLVAQELYAKYVMFNAKNEVTSKESFIRELSETENNNYKISAESVKVDEDFEIKPHSIILSDEAIDLLKEELGSKEMVLRGIEANKNVLNKVDEFTLNLIPSSMKEIKYGIYNKKLSSESSKNSNLSFRDFARKFITDELGTINNKENDVILSPSPFPADVDKLINYKELIDNMERNEEYSKALKTSCESIVNNMSTLQKKALSKISMYDILSENYYTIKMNNENGEDNEIIVNKNLSSELMYFNNTLDKIHISFESMYALLDNKDELKISSETIMEYLAGGNVEKMIEETKSIKKNEKMFRSLLGETHMILENHRVIPISANGDGEIDGAFYFDYTEQDMHSLTAARSLAASQIMTPTGIPEDGAVEDTFARFVLSDTIIETIQKNLNKNVIRNNPDILYAIKTILDEHEFLLNNNPENSDVGPNSYTTAAKIRFIPGDHLVFFKNGSNDTFLGDSMIQKTKPYSTNYIMLNDSYTSWYVIDGKGFTVFTLEKGLEQDGAKAARRMLPQIKALAPYRSMWREPGRYDQSVSRKYIIQLTAAGEKPFDIQDYDPPDFRPDREFLDTQQLLATSIIGTPSTLFSELNAGSGQTATKAIFQEGRGLSKVINMQREMLVPSCRLFTMVSRFRTGLNNIVLWEPPVPSKLNLDTKKEILSGRIELYKSILEEIMELYGDEEEFKTNAIKKTLFKNILGDIPELSDIENIESEAEIENYIKLAQEQVSKKK